ncbi:MAG TPA: primosomal protein N' [Vicinamibacteria bacterium]|nr:primosomal protein N' [Vicinamibacteria bacterium]
MSRDAVLVALPLPVQTAFTYRVAGRVPERGVRVVVPFGPRKVVGVVTGPAAGDEGRALKDVIDVLDEEPLIAPPLLDLVDWVAGHYLAPPGECHRLAMPPAGVRASRAMVRLAASSGENLVLAGTAPADADPVVAALREGPLRLSTLASRLGHDPAGRLARLRREGVVEVEQDLRAPGFRLVRWAILREVPAVAPRGKAQAELLDRLRAAGGRMPVADLVRDRSSLRGALQRLVDAGAVRIDEERADRAPRAGEADVRGLRLALTRDQAAVLDVLLPALDARAFRPFLLHGVTGSGKTEVYFRAAERTLEQDRGVLILVPEIGLTPLLVRAAAARFGSTVCVVHSELSAGERHDQWWRIRDGECRIVVGARSAVFAPIPDLGLVVVDEEHDAAYKQDETPRYHGRDVAVMRAKLEGAIALLGSATPSLETFTNAEQGKYERLALPRRISAQGLPRVDVVDRRQVMKAGGDAILTPPLREAIEARLARREQTLLLLNRRGYAISLLCRECGLEADCPNCSVSLALHEGGRRAVCHYCGHQAPPPRACPSCKGEYLKQRGYGTEKVVEAVRAAFPQATVDRLDRDRAARRGELERALRAFESGQTQILVGTQMIAKGHDFPRVTLVGVVDADVGLGLPDFRSAERTFQLLTQVSGRAGRADLPGEVILQSHLPDHYALRYACTQDYASFFAEESVFRRTMAYPPSAALLNLVVRGKEAEPTAREADALARRLREGAAAGKYRVLGPARAPLAKLRQDHRFQVLMKGGRAAMREAVRSAMVERYGEVRWPGVVIDVDPLSVM